MPEPTKTRRSLNPLHWRGEWPAVRDEMQDMFSQFVDERGWFGRIAPADLCELDNSLEITLDLPGVNPQDIEIKVIGNNITICGHRQEVEETPGRTYHRVERRTGDFSRTITLPCAVDEAKVEARYRDGILTITLPKTEAAKAHKIPVRT